MSENIISWNVANWVTITIMAALGLSVVGVVSSFVRPRMASAPSAVPDQTPQDE